MEGNLETLKNQVSLAVVEGKATSADTDDLSATMDSHTCRVKGKSEMASPSAFIPLQGEREGDKVSGVGLRVGVTPGGGHLVDLQAILTSLDNLYKNKCNKFPDWVFINKQTGDVRPFRCKCRDCEPCWRINVGFLRTSVVKAILRWDLTRLLSLTLDPKKLTRDPYEELGDVWHKFCVYLQREAPGLKYIWFKGVHRSGIPHLHVLVNRYLKQAWVSRTWSRLGGGRIVDIRGFPFVRIDVERVTNYVTSYLTKRDELEQLPRGKRWFGSSRGVIQKREKTSGWVLFTPTRILPIDWFNLKFLLKITDKKLKNPYIRSMSSWVT